MSVEITVPALGESVVEATVGQWFKSEGDAVEVDEPLVELETDKVNQEIRANEAGVLQSIAKQEGETVGVGDVLAVIEAATAPRPNSSPNGESEGRAAGEARAESAPETSTEDENSDAGRATPLARRIAAEHEVDLSQVQGTGPSGRIKREDVTSYIEQQGQPTMQSQPAAPPARPTAPAPVPAPLASNGRQEERVRMSRRRQTIARRLVEAQQTAAMLTTFNEVDMGAIMELRKLRKDAFKERYGVNLGFMSFFTRAAIGALKAFPRLNAEIQGDEMVLKQYYDIGIAVGAEDGLVVPVLRDADRLNFAEIEQGIGALAEKARNKTLSLDELQGGTFTISNGGIFGSLLSTPILNTPQVGILGMHKIQERPVALDGDVVIRPMMYLALSYDHRIVDGSEAVRFLVRLKELVEDPTSLLLEG